MSEELAESVKVSMAVAAQLSDASRAGLFGELTFNARHWTMPIFTREELASLCVTTRARGDRRSRASRKIISHDYPIEVTMRLAVSSDNSLQVDRMIYAAQKIADYWEQEDPATGQTRTLVGRSEKLIELADTEFAEEELHKHRVMKCQTLLTFRGWR